MIFEIILFITGILIGFILGWYFGCFVDKVISRIVWGVTEDEIDEDLNIR